MVCTCDSFFSLVFFVFSVFSARVLLITMNIVFFRMKHQKKKNKLVERDKYQNQCKCELLAVNWKLNTKFNYHITNSLFRHRRSTFISLSDRKIQRGAIRFGLFGFISRYKKKKGRVIIWSVLHCARTKKVISPCLFENLFTPWSVTIDHSKNPVST